MEQVFFQYNKEEKLQFSKNVEILDEETKEQMIKLAKTFIKGKMSTNDFLYFGDKIQDKSVARFFNLSSTKTYKKRDSGWVKFN